MLDWWCLQTRELTFYTDFTNYHRPTFCGWTCCKCDNHSFRERTQTGVPTGCKSPRVTLSKGEMSDSTAKPLGAMYARFFPARTQSHTREFSYLKLLMSLLYWDGSGWMIIMASDCKFLKNLFCQKIQLHMFFSILSKYKNCIYVKWGKIVDLMES